MMYTIYILVSFWLLCSWKVCKDSLLIGLRGRGAVAFVLAFLFYGGLIW